MGSLRAVVVYRAAELLPRAYRECGRRDWRVVSIVPKDRYGEALSLIGDGLADIIVAASPDSLDPDRIPRVEIIDDDEGDADSRSSE